MHLKLATVMTIVLLASLAFAGRVMAQPSLETGSVLAAAERLRPGEFLWVPEVAPEGPVLLVVSLATQRAVIYRNGLPIGISTVSTGRPGHTTPTGIFTVLQREADHHSNLYNNAPMPFMQRLTWSGVALHGGDLPGYPASHGCIRLPREFARLIWGVTRIGMTVVVTDRAVVPRIAPAEALLSGAPLPENTDQASWHPERALSGPVSIVISASDRRMVVLRNGIVIGMAPASIDAGPNRATAFVLQQDRSWIRIVLPGQQQGDGATESLRGHVHIAPGVRERIEAILQPGTTVVLTNDSLRLDSARDVVSD
jgi:hypothetical protein